MLWSMRAAMRGRTRGVRRRLLALASAMAGFGAAPGMARAQEASVTAYLEWNEPALSPCPSRDALVVAVEARLKRRVFVAERAASDVRLVATVRRRDAAWGVELELRDRQDATLGTRYVRSRGADCGGLGESLPVVVALLIDLPRRDVIPGPPDVAAETRAPLDAAPVAPPPPPATGPTGAPPRASGAVRARVAVAGELASGVLPDLATGASLQGGIVTSGGWAVELEAGATLPSTVRTAAGSATFTSVYGALTACAPLVRGSLALSVCTGMRLGPLLAEGSSFDRNEARARPFPEVPVGAVFFLRLDARATAPLARERFVFRADTGDVVPLHEPAAVAPRVAIGAGVTFF
jgi:hypothetical protein